MDSKSSDQRGRMPVSQRAKIFLPFDPLRGFQAALREQERLAEERFAEQERLNDKRLRTRDHLAESDPNEFAHPAEERFAEQDF